MKLLITGAGGAAAISVWKSLNQEHDIFMVDIDPCAAGLYLVPASRRLLVPRGDAPDFVDRVFDICVTHQIELLIPTVDVELYPLASQSTRFQNHGIHLPLSSADVLQCCRDKYALLSKCQETGLIPRYEILTSAPLKQNEYPLFAKPRYGAGSSGIMTLTDHQDLEQLPRDGSYLIQEVLSGEEYSVDVYIRGNGRPLAAVPRLRMKIDSGIAVAAQTRIVPELSDMALLIAEITNIRYVANIQFKANAHGQFKLLEINPRFPGTLPLTAAAGIDIPKLLIQDISGHPFSDSLLPYKELMVVRYWTEQFFHISEWEKLCQT
ncbi:ATP-grasp domain-containing protein [Legionella sp. CNM-4043-24]|uniref:ATP-grasp domain-containing protein n=1 Tax=Legionella sp. CNM-4043-24 TaxID=3421646 RepID=UPI00403A966C